MFLSKPSQIQRSSTDRYGHWQNSGAANYDESLKICAESTTPPKNSEFALADEPTPHPFPPEDDGLERLRGVLSRVRFASENGEFAVCELTVDGESHPITIVGNILATQPGESVEVVGEWQDDARFGRQLRIRRLRAILPVTRKGIERYLSGGFIDGIGPVLAERIVDAFGEKTLEILDEDPKRLAEVDGIGKVRLERIQSAWYEQRAIRDVMVFLQSHSISPTFAIKIFRLYGERAPEIIQDNPYKLAEDVFGIGFRKADAIARSTGLEHDAVTRLRAGVMFALGQAHSEGHMFLPMDELRERAAELLEVEEDSIGAAIEELKYEEKLVIEPIEGTSSAIWRHPAYHAEVEAARHLRRLLEVQPLLKHAGPDQSQLDQIEDTMGISLARAQREAVMAAWQHKVVVITGGPGTGKTTIIRAVVTLGERGGAKVSLAAPTGRAAKRLGEATGREARTLHRMLEFSFQEGGFQVNDEAPLDVDLLIVDEASMIDTYLLHAIARAMPDHARLLLVGDIDQLPSVGPGNVLSDIIGCGQIEVVRLTEIFRQAQQSNIVRNAHRINAGELPIIPERTGKELVDFYAINTEEPRAARDRILEMVTERIPKAFGYDPLEDVQILSPMHKGDVGCRAINEMLQNKLNPGAVELVRGARRWKVGDKVMQLRNNYEQDVFNGDIGKITDIDHLDKLLTVTFPDRGDVAYDFNTLDELALAYAITVHKSQGSEYPAVVIPVVTQHFIMLQRNLLYTAITRAKELVILVGTQKALGIAVRNDTAQQRFTRLSARLLGPDF